MGERIEWVQIIEPKSKDIMYANLVTGECLWEAPIGAKIKRMDENQWWELFDINTKRNYYYNSKSQRTVWQRPLNADIIPLAKLQMIKENTETPSDEQTMITSSTIHQTHQQLTPSMNKHIPSQMTQQWKQTSSQGLDRLWKENGAENSSSNFNSTIQQRPVRRTATVLNPNTTLPSSRSMYQKNDSNDQQQQQQQQKLQEDLSEGPSINKRSQSIQSRTPFNYGLVNNENINHYSSSIATPPAPPPTSKTSPNILRHISTPSLEFSYRHSPHTMSLSRSSFGRNHIRKKQPRTNPNYINIQVQSNDGSVRSTYIRLNDSTPCQAFTLSSTSSNSSSEQDSILDCSQSYSNDSNGYFPSDETISTDRAHQQKANGSTMHQSLSSQPHYMQTLPSKTTRNNGRLIVYNDVMPHTHRSITTNGDSKSNVMTVSSPIYYDDHSNRFPFESYAMNRSEEFQSDDSSSYFTRSTSVQLETSSHEKENFHRKFTTPMSNDERKSSAILVDIEPDMLNTNSHRRGLFSKRLTQDHQLTWSKEGITKPLFRTMDKILKREAAEIFKLIQIYMGDRKSKQIASLSTCLELTTKGWSLPSIRDELYLQLIKQTNDNPNAESLQRGWELLAICLSFFPPSGKFQGLLERYISIQTNAERNTPEVPISIYAKVCQKRLEKILQTGPKKGLRKPTYEEIELSKHTIHFPSMFGATLEEVMAMQRTRYPDRCLPWIQTTLSEEVLRLNGTQIEGIFRVPGDLDNVNALKVKCDQWHRPALEDPHLPASLLKLWYRELAEPLIPSIFYDRCIMNCDKVEPCLRLVDALPDINRSVLLYLIRFLQIFIAPEHVALTKMDVNNLSMVFAPNILRCNSDDAKIIFENARKEMLFVKILILHLNTDAIEGVL